jgi:sulfite reductase beta subunit-like hemoprotein
MNKADAKAGATAATEEYAKSLRQVYTTVLDAAIASQERNVKFTQSVFERGMEELKNQTETATDVVQSVAQQTQKQRATLETLAHQSVDAYLDYVHNVVSLYAKGLEAIRQATE